MKQSEILRKLRMTINKNVYVTLNGQVAVTTISKGKPNWTVS